MWHRLNESLHGREDIDSLDEKLLNLDSHLEQNLVRLTVKGSITLEDNRYLEQRIERFEASFRYFSFDHEHLHMQMTDDDLNRVDTGGFVRKAAIELKHLMEHVDEHQRWLASQALKRLYVELIKLEAQDS